MLVNVAFAQSAGLFCEDYSVEHPPALKAGFMFYFDMEDFMGKTCSFLIDFKDTLYEEEESILMDIFVDLIKHYDVDTFFLNMREKTTLTALKILNELKNKFSNISIVQVLSTEAEGNCVNRSYADYFDKVIRLDKHENENSCQAALRQSNWLYQNSDFWITRIYKENNYETLGVVIAPKHCKLDF